LIHDGIYGYKYLEIPCSLWHAYQGKLQRYFSDYQKLRAISCSFYREKHAEKESKN